MQDKNIIPFKDREQAGKLLSESLLPLKSTLNNPIVLGIPRGGIPVGFSIALSLNCPLDTIVLRKLPIPDNPEAGFGAVTLDKVVIFNEQLLSQIHLSRVIINKIINEVYKEVLRRNKVYRQDKAFPALKNRSVILTDDGLASGYTMLAGIKFVQGREPDEIIVAVPVAHRQAYNLVKESVDKIIALHISDLPFFAVASFYKEFPDMADDEVVDFLDTPD